MHETVSNVQVSDLNILAIAASTSLCSLALKTPLGVLSWHSQETNKHSEQLLPAVADLLRQAGLVKPDLIAVDIGPGAFTSVRVACGVAKGLALGWGCLVLPVQSLTALAYQAVAIHPTIVTLSCVIDARMSECYVAQYEVLANVGGFEVSQKHSPRLMAYETIKNLSADCVIGNAANVLPQWGSLEGKTIDAAPSAQGVLDAAVAVLHNGKKAVLPELIQPLYVRNQVAYTAAERLAGLDK